MAHYNGAVSLPVNTYDAFRNAVLGNSYDFDGISGCQCVDLPKELNYNLGYSSPYWDTGGTGKAYGGWTVTSARNFNAGTQYDLIYNKYEIKRGDMIVMNWTPQNEFGHVTFADEDYNGTNQLACLGQNQGGGTPAPGGGTTAVVTNLGLSDFLGAFRLKAWNVQPITYRKHKFPWVLYARKLRKQ